MAGSSAAPHALATRAARHEQGEGHGEVGRERRGGVRRGQLEERGAPRVLQLRGELEHTAPHLRQVQVQGAGCRCRVQVQGAGAGCRCRVQVQVQMRWQMLF